MSQKLKMSTSNKGKTFSEETRLKLSAANKGKILSDDHRFKMSIAHKGKIHSEETRLKMSKPKSEETKNRMRLAQLRRRSIDRR